MSALHAKFDVLLPDYFKQPHLINKESIKQKASAHFEMLKQTRRYLHQHPELSFHESKTAKYISGLLTDWNIEHQTGVAGNGIVGLIKGRNPGTKTIALRADIDALPINEKNNVEYRSLNSGVMHACGHDVHTSCLLGAVKILDELKQEFDGTVKFIFQPAEETLPGGAQQMIAEGVLENPKPLSIVAQHVFPDLPVGKVGFKKGEYMASSDEINLYVKGKGGHAAIPHSGDDTVFTAAQLIVDIKKKVAEQTSLEIPVVLSFGKIIGNGAHNVFPAKVSIHGTLRTFDESWRRQVHQIISEVAATMSVANNLTCEVDIQKGYPVLINDDKTTGQAVEAAKEFLGSEQVVSLPRRMTVEDFAYFAQKVPACFYRLGVANPEKGITSGLHTPTFDVDEESIKTGTGLLTWIALKQLEKTK